MVSYSRILNEISRRFGTGLSGPGSGTAPGAGVGPADAPEPDAPEEKADAPEPAELADSGLQARTREIDSEFLARIFREESQASGKAGVPPAVKDPGGAKAETRPPPFRNHAELLKFASGLIADIEASLRAKG